MGGQIQFVSVVVSKLFGLFGLFVFFFFFSIFRLCEVFHRIRCISRLEEPRDFDGFLYFCGFNAAITGSFEYSFNDTLKEEIPLDRGQFSDEVNVMECGLSFLGIL